MSEFPQSSVESDSGFTPKIFTIPSVLGLLKKHFASTSTEILAWLQSPQNAIEKFPQSGSWEPILVRGVSWGVLSGLLSALLTVVNFPAFALMQLIATIVLAVPALFIGAFVVNFLLGKIATEPGFYRTAYFGSLLGVLGPIAVVAGFMHSLFGLLVNAAAIYSLFQYAVFCAQCERKKAWYFVGGLTVLLVIAKITFGAPPLRYAKQATVDPEAVELLRLMEKFPH